MRRPMVMRFRRILTTLLLSAGSVAAQTPRDTSAAVIRAGRFFDSETGAMVANREILVERGRVVEVGATVRHPPGARIIDLTRYSVLPGLIDAHTHLLYLESPKGSLTTEGLKALVIEGLPLRALHGAARARTFLAAGITTVRDLGNSGRFGDVALRDAIEDGSVDGPRMIVSGPGLSPIGGQFPGLRPGYESLATDEYRIVRGEVDAAEAVRENVTFGASVIKIFSNNTPNPGNLTSGEIEAIVTAAKAHGVRVAAHATSDAAVWRAAQAGVHSVEHGYAVADSTLALMAAKGVALVPTDVDSVGITRYVTLQSGVAPPPAAIGRYLAAGRNRLMRAVRAGVTIAAGSDNYLDLGLPQGQAAKHNLFAYVTAGMTPVQALQAATVNDAKLLGYEGKLGVIKPGAFADMIAVDGDPVGGSFDALDRVVFVMKDGTEYFRRAQ